ncbi:MAG: hypothetical protein J7621_02150 [Niastella sp.]|nr:hypothetical protein [Niastella sp.]
MKKSIVFSIILLLLVLFNGTAKMHYEKVNLQGGQFYWILHDKQTAWFTYGFNYRNATEAAEAFKNYCQRKNFMQYNRRVEGPFANAEALGKARNDAARQWRNSGFQVVDWLPEK